MLFLSLVHVYIQLVGEGRKTYYLIDKSGSIGIKYEYEGGTVMLWKAGGEEEMTSNKLSKFG